MELESWKLMVVLLAGIPHGAADVQLALGAGKARNAAIIFMIYLSLAILTFYLWAIYPLPLTLLFFGISAWHFGESDAPKSGVGVKGLLGLWHISLLTIPHPEVWQTAWPDAAIFFSGVPNVIWTSLALFIWLLGIGVWRLGIKLPWAILVLHGVGLYLSFEFHFLLYFLCWHTPQALHFARKALKKDWTSFFRLLTPLSILAWLLLAGLYHYAPSGSGVWWMFGGVIALTFPHTFLFHRLFSRS